MKKAVQIEMNTNVLAEIEKINQEMQENISRVGRLRSCSAQVFETENYYILQSYATIIAAIHKETDTLYDFLRHVYGYTTTSGKHIAKFRQDYGSGQWGCEKQLTYREVA